MWTLGNKEQAGIFFILVLFLVLMIILIVYVLRQSNKQVPQKEVRVLGLNGCGLGNHLFQVACAVYYSEMYDYEIVLNSSSDGVMWGSSSFTNRDRIRRIQNERVPYTQTIFRKLNNRAMTSKPQPFAETIFNQYTGDKVVPKNAVLQVDGLCQNKSLFEDIIPYLPHYLDLHDHKTFRHLQNTYNLNQSQKHNVMVSMRLCLDFAHMSKVNASTMRHAIEVATSGREKVSRLIIIADVSTIEGRWKEILRGYDYVIVDEDDVTQFYAGLCCSHLILGESTYHYWIAVCRKSLHPKNTKVFLFENTDLTLRPLCLKDWEVLPLVSEN